MTLAILLIIIALVLAVVAVVGTARMETVRLLAASFAFFLGSILAPMIH